MPRLPLTRSEVFYSYEIKINKVVVGTLRSFNPTQTRSTSTVYEVATNGGEIFEIVPGVPTYTVRLSKVRLYSNLLLNHFGILSQDIQKQVQSIDIIETVWKPANVPNESISGPAEGDKSGTRAYSITYEDCWITDWGKTVSTDAITIVEDMTVLPTRVLAG